MYENCRHSRFKSSSVFYGIKTHQVFPITLNRLFTVRMWWRKSRRTYIVRSIFVNMFFGGLDAFSVKHSEICMWQLSGEKLVIAHFTIFTLQLSLYKCTHFTTQLTLQVHSLYNSTQLTLQLKFWINKNIVCFKIVLFVFVTSQVRTVIAKCINGQIQRGGSR